MISVTDLPYAPSLYVRNCTQVTITTSPQKLLVANYRRIFLKVVNIAIGAAVNPAMMLGQVSNQGTVITNSATGDFEIWWEQHKILCGLDLYSIGYAAGNVFSITEVLYNPLPSGVRINATRKFESTTGKIQDTISAKRGNGGRYKSGNRGKL